MQDMTHGEFVAHVETRVHGSTLEPLEYDEILAELTRRAQEQMAPLAFHGWLATSFGLSTGLVTEAELETIGDDVYWVLFELEARGVLEELELALADGRVRV